MPGSLHDILLPRPLDPAWLHGLLFFTFVIHFLFVLLTVGAAVLGLVALVRRHWRSREELDHRSLLRPFFVHKSLAIVLGVGALLLMQLGNTVPFFTGINLTAPLWMLIVVFLLLSLLLLEATTGDRIAPRTAALVTAALGVAFILAVPASFAAVLVATENPDRWQQMLRAGNRFDLRLTLHWLLRVLHVIGAGVVTAAVFQRFVITTREPQRTAWLARWGTGALVFQLVAGVGLYASLPRSPSPLATVVILAAVLFAALLLSRLARGGLLLRRATASGLLLGILLPMLLARQVLQDQVLAPLRSQLDARAAESASELAPFKAAAMNAWDAWRNVTYDQPYSMYRGSCNICHGAVTSGTGREAWRLAVPPEDLSALRASSSELRRILSSGVPGTAMPRFGIYTRDRQDGIISLLRTAGLREAPEPLPVSISPASGVTAHAVFVSRCGFCHGPDGTGTEQSSHFLPPPPNLQVLSLSPQRAFAVIRTGYPGTMMPAFADLSEETRWALVQIVLSFFRR